MLTLLARRVTQVFIPAVFLYVFIEQGLGTWLPSINHLVLGLDAGWRFRRPRALRWRLPRGGSWPGWW
jgi:hypothetical protein